jgi:hypothetical protein
MNESPLLRMNTMQHVADASRTFRMYAPLMVTA